MSLQQGIWDFTGNGSVGQLNINLLDNQGNLSGTVFGDPIQGFWDESSQKITFMRIINANDPSTFQVYTGYLFLTSTTFTLTGFFEAFSGTGAVAQRILYGWYAQAPQGPG